LVVARSIWSWRSTRRNLLVQWSRILLTSRWMEILLEKTNSHELL
jgi:hypothetical protein